MHVRPPRVDVACARSPRASSSAIEMMRQRAAAAAAFDAKRRDADAVEHARACGVDVRLQRRLHAAFHDEHLARVARRGPRARALRQRNAIAELARQQALRRARPTPSALPNSVRDSSVLRSAQRCAASAGARPTFASTTRRPMSSSRPYCTPDGHVVSQLRQVRQRSRCSCVFAVTGAPSSTCLMR